MLVSAWDAEVAEYVARHRSDRDEQGRALVVRNGKARPRKVTLGAGTVEIAAPRVARSAERVDDSIGSCGVSADSGNILTL